MNTREEHSLDSRFYSISWHTYIEGCEVWLRWCYVMFGTWVHIIVACIVYCRVKSVYEEYLAKKGEEKQ